MSFAALPVLFILGPSGVGKSTLGGWVSEDLGFLHVEIDRWPHGDGIDAENLRAEWDAFWTTAQAKPLAAAIRARVARANSRGAVLTFPSLVVLSAEQLSAAKQTGVHVIVLYGTQADCLQAFLRREQESGRGLGEDHWLQHNAGTHARFADAAYASHRILAFQGGHFRERAAILAEVRQRPANML